MPVEPAAGVAEAVGETDVVVTATWSREPFLFPGMVQAGTHVTTLSPDEPSKLEVDASLLREALFVCDDRGLAVDTDAAGGARIRSYRRGAGQGGRRGARGPPDPDQITAYGGVASHCRTWWPPGTSTSERETRASGAGRMFWLESTSRAIRVPLPGCGRRSRCRPSGFVAGP